jgi:hypothetical protein
VDEPTAGGEVRVAPRASYAPLDRLPGRFRAGRSGWPKTQFGSTMGSFCMIGIASRSRLPGMGPAGGNGVYERACEGMGCLLWT